MLKAPYRLRDMGLAFNPETCLKASYLLRDMGLAFNMKPIYQMDAETMVSASHAPIGGSH